MKAQKKAQRKAAFEFETIKETVTRRGSLRSYEHDDLLLAVDDLAKDCTEQDSTLFAVAQETVDVIAEMVDLSENLAMVQDGVSDIANHLDADGWDAYDASRELEDYAATLAALDSDLREAARMLILLVREVIDFKD